mmetsp:Transcript_8264/g.27492  ORF Transcript_8264/g.27492 Transcript_8264/m.27492 type:complete len:281 (-) Transcript_8264:1486-2328(-)
MPSSSASISSIAATCISTRSLTKACSLARRALSRSAFTFAPRRSPTARSICSRSRPPVRRAYPAPALRHRIPGHCGGSGTRPMRFESASDLFIGTIATTSASVTRCHRSSAPHATTQKVRFSPWPSYPACTTSACMRMSSPRSSVTASPVTSAGASAKRSVSSSRTHELCASSAASLSRWSSRRASSSLSMASRNSCTSSGAPAACTRRLSARSTSRVISACLARSSDPANDPNDRSTSARTAPSGRFRSKLSTIPYDTVKCETNGSGSPFKSSAHSYGL